MGRGTLVKYRKWNIGEADRSAVDTLRSAGYSWLLASVLAACGADVTREFYVNDAGHQIDKFAHSIEARYLQIIQGEENVPFPEDGYQGEDIKDLARAYYEENGDKLVSAPEQERLDTVRLIPWERVDEADRRWIIDAERREILDRGLLDRPEEPMARYLRTKYPESWARAGEERERQASPRYHKE